VKDEAAQPDEIRNEITDAVVIGPVVQAGTFSGQIHHHHADSRQPLDLLTLRLWVERIAADHGAQVEGDRKRSKHLRQVDQVRAGLADPATADAVRRLMIAGMVGYLARSGPPPERPVLGQILLDLVVFSLWPVVTARKLPPGWEGEVAQLTSPRLAVLVQRARAERKPSAEAFSRAVASGPLESAITALFDDLADPRGSGALLTGMALAGGLKPPPTGRNAGKKVAVWALVIVGGATLAHALSQRDSRASRLLGELVLPLSDDPGDPLDLADAVKDVLDWLLN
jgi:hypothetical protein